MNVERMKQLLLERAIQGKLVPQLDEEPAVEQIGEAPKEVPFEIPGKWKWCTLSELSVSRKTINPKELSDEIVELLSIPAYDAGEPEFINPSLIGSAKKLVSAGDVLLSKIVPSIKRAWVVPDSSYKQLASTEWLVFKHLEFDPFFLRMVFMTPYFRTKIGNTISGMGSLKRANPKMLGKTHIPIPPLSEQRRIVARLQTLLPLIETYEKNQAELKRLAELFKASLLQKAIQGKLVPQLDEEPAVGLLGEAPKVVPFEIPEKWKWSTIDNALQYGSSKQISGSEIPVSSWILDLEDIEKNTGKLLCKQKCKVSASTKTIFSNGDVLYGKLRPYLNKCIVADEDGFCTTEIVPIRSKDDGYSFVPQYIQAFLLSPFFVSHANACSYGVKMPRLGTKDAKSSLIPVPPLPEQRRIVARLQELQALADKLIDSAP